MNQGYEQDELDAAYRAGCADGALHGQVGVVPLSTEAAERRAAESVADLTAVAHMPDGYEGGLAAWVGRLYRAYIGAEFAPEVRQQIADGRLFFPDAPVYARVAELEAEVASLRAECDDPLNLLWNDIILKKYPNYGDWEYPGQAYRHIVAEFNDLSAEIVALKAANEARRPVTKDEPPDGTWVQVGDPRGSIIKAHRQGDKWINADGIPFTHAPDAAPYYRSLPTIEADGAGVTIDVFTAEEIAHEPKTGTDSV